MTSRNITDVLDHFIRTWEWRGVGDNVATLQDGPDTSVTIRIDDLRAALAALLSASKPAAPMDFYAEIDRIAGDYSPATADEAVLALGEMRDALHAALSKFAAAPAAPAQSGEPVAIVLPVVGTGSTDLQGNLGVTVVAQPVEQAAEPVAWFHNTASPGDKPHYEQVAEEYAKAPAIPFYAAPQPYPTSAALDKIKVTCEYADRIELVDVIDAKMVDDELHIAIRALSVAQPVEQTRAPILREAAHICAMQGNEYAEGGMAERADAARYCAHLISQEVTAARPASGETE